VGELLAESFAALAREAPEAHLRIRRHLAGLSVRMEVDDERFSLAFSSNAVDVAAGPGSVDAHVATTSAAIDALLDGELAVANAVLEDRLRVVAPLDVLVRLQEGLRLYIHGAVRSVSFPEFLQRFRALKPKARMRPSERGER
jgi:hypothetical protein